MAIISYMRAFGLGYGRMFDRMQEVLPEDYRYAVKDKSQISEFLKGSEPEDEKIRAFLNFLKLERPEIVHSFGEYTKIEEVGDDLVGFLSNVEGIKGYDKVMDWMPLLLVHI